MRLSLVTGSISILISFKTRFAKIAECKNWMICVGRKNTAGKQKAWKALNSQKLLYIRIEDRFLPICLIFKLIDRFDQCKNWMICIGRKNKVGKQKAWKACNSQKLLYIWIEDRFLPICFYYNSNVSLAKYLNNFLWI